MEAQKGRGCSQHSQLLWVFALWVRRTQSPSPAEGTHRGAPDSHASSPPPAQPRRSGSVYRECPPGHGPLTPQGPCRLHGQGPSLASLPQQWERDWCQPASPVASKAPSARAPNGIEKQQLLSQRPVRDPCEGRPGARGWAFPLGQRTGHWGGIQRTADMVFAKLLGVRARLQR